MNNSWAFKRPFEGMDAETAPISNDAEGANEVSLLLTVAKPRTAEILVWGRGFRLLRHN